MEKKWIIGIDQSTQGTKAVLIDANGLIIDKTYLTHEQIISPEGWVSHNGEEIWKNTCLSVKQLLGQNGIQAAKIAAIGISNQRETTIAWDRETGTPVGEAIVWQCDRGREVTEMLAGTANEKEILEKTGIPLSPYFPAAKAGWIMKHREKARDLAEQGRLCIGTVDSFLVFRMTRGEKFRTDYSNASRTQLFDIHALCWDEKIAEAFGIPIKALPEVESSDGDFGFTDLDGILEEKVHIRGVMGDSHAALFGQGCLLPGMAKATYGTGSSVMMNIGTRPVKSSHGLVTSLAWKRKGQVDYVLEGNINYSGAVITWLQKDLGLIGSAAESEKLARQANPADRTYLVPAFTGLGAPYWKEQARGVFCGMSRTTGRAELVKAGLESIAYQVSDICEAMEKDATVKLSELRVDGGPTANGYLMQLQADLADAKVRVPRFEELSALGAALMAGISTGWMEEELAGSQEAVRVYEPSMEQETRQQKKNGWNEALTKA